ncbi:hypothetical protein [Winogradskyella psychrotolerans]|uniref:hypothetical protein n=1 Tax=Winogradskyella psychrotolerans TaxID=1344585 RepID=UPI001C0679E9|nr:hypothetical protein [Winogradskyella psychrotolerans]MBU2930144.1 hypothetical protein [Winogradskyella psychrotolerans]
MKDKQLILSILFVCIVQSMSGQKLEQNDVEKLKDILNSDVAANFKVELTNNQAHCSIGEFNKTLDLRSEHEIAEDSLTKLAKKKLYTGRYIGPVFWKYGFTTTLNSGVDFKSNKYQQVFCTISFKDQDTIRLRSMLNAYTSYHKLSNSASHIVEWTGDKYISLLLTPTKEDNKINFELNGITLSGKFEREDKKELDKNYTKSLRTILKREFKKLFESNGMAQLVSEKWNN